MKLIYKSIAVLLSLGVMMASAAAAATNVKFATRSGDLVAQFADRGIQLGSASAPVQIEFAGAGRLSAVNAEDGSFVYRDTWPGIENCIEPYRQAIKSEYRVAAGADPGIIRLRYNNLGSPRILPDGSLLVKVAGGEFTDSAPYAYQNLDGRVPVAVAYRVFDDGTVGFSLGPYDRSRPLVIDPVMNYSTLFGGSGDTSVTSVALDSFGNAVVAGWTTASDLPANGARQKSGGSVDAFVAKLSAQGNKVVWCTYLGGIGDDRAFGVAVDPSNNVYVTGYTQSTNFPLVGAIQTRLLGSRNAFVTKLNATGTSIVYSSYLGGNSHDQAYGIAVDSTGAAYVTGDAYSTNFPVRNGYQSTFAGGQQDAFVTKLNPAGNALVFSTFVGGSAADHGAAIALDASNNVYVTGSTYSSNFPVANATQARIGGGQDAFAIELSAAGNALLFGTYIGGSGGTPGLTESGNAITVDRLANVYVAGATSSIDFPTSAGGYQRTLTNGGAEDHGFVWKLNASKQIVYSTYLAGMNMDVINDIAADPAGNAYVVGSTSSTDFPGVRAFQSALLGITSAFVLKLNATGSALIFGSFLGGTSSDCANSIAIDSKQNMVIGGLAQSSDFPLLNAAQSYSNGPFSAFVTRVVPGWYPVTFSNGGWYSDVWHDAGWDGSNWTLAVSSFGQAGDVPIIGDWTKSGSTKIGVFRNGLWILDSNGNGRIDSGDRQFTFGQAGDIPIVGDWDGTGTMKAGLFRRGYWILDVSGHMSGVATGKQDITFYFGLGTDVPVVGDWGSTGVTKIGTFRNGSWYLDATNDHNYNTGDLFYVYGQTGDTPVVGDWDGSGTPKIGVSRSGYWMLNISGTGQYVGGVDTTFYDGSSGYSFLIGR